MMPEEQLVFDLFNPELRGNALAELSKKRETFKDLAPLLWQSFGTIALLLKEIVSVYKSLSPPTLSANASSRTCNALSLLQSVASHPETRTPFFKADIPMFVYPFLETTSNTRSIEFLRLTSLGIVGALVKGGDTEAVAFLLNREVIPLCLQIMETGSELSKTVAIFIVLKIVLDEVGLQHVCETVERFFNIARVLTTMVLSLAAQPSVRLLKQVIHCYLRLTDNPTARIALQISLPEVLKNGTFDNCLKADPVARQWLQQLLDKLAGPAGEAPHQGAGPVAGGAPHPGPGPAAVGSPGGSSQEGPCRAPGM